MKRAIGSMLLVLSAAIVTPTAAVADPWSAANAASFRHTYLTSYSPAVAACIVKQLESLPGSYQSLVGLGDGFIKPTVRAEVVLCNATPGGPAKTPSAHFNTVAQDASSGDTPSVDLSANVRSPAGIEVKVTSSTTGQRADVQWSVAYSKNGLVGSKTGSYSGLTPSTDLLPIPEGADDVIVNVGVTLNATGDLHVVIQKETYS